MAKSTLTRHDILDMYIDLNNKIIEKLYDFKKDNSEYYFRYAVRPGDPLNQISDRGMPFIDVQNIKETDSDFMKAIYCIRKKNNQTAFSLLEFYYKIEERIVLFKKDDRAPRFSEISINSVDKMFNELWSIIYGEILDCVKAYENN